MVKIFLRSTFCFIGLSIYLYVYILYCFTWFYRIPDEISCVMLLLRVICCSFPDHFTISSIVVARGHQKVFTWYILMEVITHSWMKVNLFQEWTVSKNSSYIKNVLCINFVGGYQINSSLRHMKIKYRRLLKKIFV